MRENNMPVLAKSKDFFCEKFIFNKIDLLFEHHKYSIPSFINDDCRVAEALSHIVFSPLSDKKQDKLFKNFMDNNFYNNVNPQSERLFHTFAFATCIRLIEKHTEKRVSRYYDYLEQLYPEKKYNEIVLSSSIFMLYSFLKDMAKKDNIILNIYFNEEGAFSKSSKELNYSIKEKETMINLALKDKSVEFCMKLGFMDRLNSLRGGDYPSGFVINDNLVKTIVPNYLDIVVSHWERAQLEEISVKRHSKIFKM